MPKIKIITICLSVLFCGVLLLPDLALADSSYTIQGFDDIGEQNNIFESGDTLKVKHTVCYEGFVPCGKKLTINQLNDKGKCLPPGKDPNETKDLIHCQVCHGFIMVNNTVSYVVVKLVPILAVLMLVVAGVMFYFGGVRPELQNRARTLIKGVVIGLALIYGAYMIVNIFLTVLGAAHVNTVSQVFKNGVFSIDCPVYVPEKDF